VPPPKEMFEGFKSTTFPGGLLIAKSINYDSEGLHPVSIKAQFRVEPGEPTLDVQVGIHTALWQSEE
jgi:hypothetical protein